MENRSSFKTRIRIDTSQSDEVRVAVVHQGQDMVVSEKMNRKKAQVVLPLLQSLLKEHNLSLKDIDEIEVQSGPGSFTGLRVGVAIANTLGAVLKVPVNGKRIGELVEPTYQ